MYWDSVQSFLAMGGYARYVWGAFGLTAALMLVEPVLVARRHRAARERARLLRDGDGEGGA